MTPAEVAAIRAKADAATPGPWSVRHYGSNDECVRTAHGDPIAWCKANVSNAERDAAFIASARIDVPALCDEVERQRARADKAEAELARVEAMRTNWGQP